MGQVVTSYSYREVPFQFFFFWVGGSANLGYSLQVEYTPKNIMVNVQILVLYVLVSCVLCAVVSSV